MTSNSPLTSTVCRFADVWTEHALYASLCQYLPGILHGFPGMFVSHVLSMYMTGL